MARRSVHKDSLASFILTVGAADMVIGGVGDRGSLFALGLLTAGGALVIRWLRQRHRLLRYPAQASAALGRPAGRAATKRFAGDSPLGERAFEGRQERRSQAQMHVQTRTQPRTQPRSQPQSQPQSQRSPAAVLHPRRPASPSAPPIRLDRPLLDLPPAPRARPNTRSRGRSGDRSRPRPDSGLGHRQQLG